MVKVTAQMVSWTTKNNIKLKKNNNLFIFSNAAISCDVDPEQSLDKSFVRTPIFTSNEAASGRYISLATAFRY